MERVSYNRGGVSGSGGRGRGRGRDGGGSQLLAQPPSAQVARSAGPESSATGGSWAAKLFAAPDHQSQTTSEPLPDISSLKISEQTTHPSYLHQNTGANLVPIKRPDSGGKHAMWTDNLVVNHFPLKFNPETIIRHYDVDAKAEESPVGRSRQISKSMLQKIVETQISEDTAGFHFSMMAYDGMKNIFSAVELPVGESRVELSDGEGVGSRRYIVTINLANELKLCRLNEYYYASGDLPSIPREVLQAMDVVMKDNPSKQRILVGQNFHPADHNQDCNLEGGITASRGFQQSLKLTSQGPSLCVDYSIAPLCKPLMVPEFLGMQLPRFSVADFSSWKNDVVILLKGLKVRLTYRDTTKKYTIVGLTHENTRDIYFDSKDPPKKVSVVDHFLKSYGKEIKYKDIPCLDLGMNNYVPMELCMLVREERYPEEKLSKKPASLLKKMSLADPRDRKNAICQIIQAEDGPCGGEVAQNFEFHVDKNMTKVVARGLVSPTLKMLASKGKNVVEVRVDEDKCHWNFGRKHVLDGRSVERWALLDFGSFDLSKTISGNFVQDLKAQCGDMGIRMGNPLVNRSTKVSGVDELRQVLASVKDEVSQQCKAGLQIIVCVMAEDDPAYKYLKFISETEIGTVTQCLSVDTSNGRTQYLSNLGLKINAKLGGNNFELQCLPSFGCQDHVMFIGADVNHSGARKTNCPSIAAVVATVNWPGVNRYAARICPQECGTERILKFGSMCAELIDAYAQLNKERPKKIIVFRDGVSEGQFDMVLNEELRDLRDAIYRENYCPTITVVVAIKRHQTRLFLENLNLSNNVPPGTVVDTTVTHPFLFDFYLCSHYGIIGTSKFTHYYVLWDEHKFTSDQMQELTYHLCFTFARCTKPVSLVPPVYYADLVAYRGRMFQEAVAELYPSSETAALEELCKLHPDPLYFLLQSIS